MYLHMCKYIQYIAMNVHMYDTCIIIATTGPQVMKL